MKRLITTTFMIGMMASSTALASDSTQIEALEAKVERLERVIDSLIKEQESATKVTLKPGLRVESADKAYRFGIDGFVQADAGFISDDDNADLADSTTIKRARLGVKGTIDRDWHYRVLTDFGNDDFQLMDGFLAYKGIKNLTIKAGQFKEFYSLEQLTAAKYWTFAEKASLAALTPKRSLGLGAIYHYKHGLISAGVFGENVNKNRNDDEGYGITARATYAPRFGDSAMLHLGLSATYRHVDQESGAVQFKNPGENTLTSAFVNTGKITNADDVSSITPELAVNLGSFGVQAEYINTHVSRETSGDLDFSAYYVEASYFLTGEKRNYNKKKGVFGKVKPKHNFKLGDKGLGAWQIAYRYSSIDLNDRDILGGEMDNHTLGVNWQPNPFIRMSGNVIFIDTDEHANTPDNDSIIYMLRNQFEF